MKISIAVITYNSSKTIIETLDSILNQSYGSRNLELIISDDASKDNTIEVIDAWLDINSSSFLDTKFLKSSVNEGVSKNCNIAWKQCSHEWIKSIGGDDILEIHCIEANLKYIQKNNDCKILFSKMRWFGYINQITPTPYELRFFEKNSRQQHEWLKRFSFNIAPSSFINNKVLKEIGYADAKYKMIEDLPLWLKFTKAGYKLHFLNEITVNYRVSESISNSDTRYMNVDFLKDLMAINKEYASSFFISPASEIIRREKLLWFYLNLMIIDSFDNERNKLSMLFGRSTWLFRPAHFIRHSWFKSYNGIASKKVKNH